MISLLYSALLSFTFAHAAQVRDPYSVKLTSKYTHSTSIRILNHGVSNSQNWLEQQIKATEVIYAQCGVRLKINIQSIVQLPLSTGQDKFYDEHGNFLPEAIMLFNDVQIGKKPNVMDVHLVDHLNSKIRRTGSIRNTMLNLGISFHPILFGRNYFGLPLEVGRESTFLAVESTRLSQKAITRMTGHEIYPRHLSLLAHEMGHQFFEGQVAPIEMYMDHWCDGQGDFCPVGNLMSSGGNSDKVWKKASMTVNYDPLPVLDARQCSLLTQHHLIHKID